MTSSIVHVLVGPAQHGVVQFGVALQAELQRLARGVTSVRAPRADALPGCIGSDDATVHTQFTDRLFGSTPAAAESSFRALACAARAAGAALTATLHDIPQPSDGAHFGPRADAYRTVVSACDSTIVSSEHERDLLREIGISGSDVQVIPLPIARCERTPALPSPGPPALGLFGFIYPGKGYDDVIAAAQGLPADVEILAIGTASSGHDSLVDDLRRVAARAGRTFRVTGHLSEDAVIPALQAVTVPVVAHQHFSASGSLNSWLAAGRRPLAPATRYTREVERRNPGCLMLFAPTRPGLQSALRTALNQPSSTWLPDGVTPRPSPPEAAVAYAEALRAVRA